MRSGDDEIGYCLITTPPQFNNPDEQNVNSTFVSDSNMNMELLKDLANVLEKHGITSTKKDETVLDVSQGKLTLEQINLIFRHLNVDLSYVDENEIVKFYSDTKHRVFPRSPGVIGRAVQNCHPRESVGTVEDIIKAFKSGAHDEAEFWLEMGGKFIYIIYNAVRDEQGNFKGVLEMMQDVTHIRSLTGSQRLLSWNHDNKGDSSSETETKPVNKTEIKENKYNITSETKIGALIKEYPFLKDFLVSLSPKYEKLKSPVVFKTMGGIATLEMVSSRGGFEVSDLIDKLVDEIDRQKHP